MVVEAPPSDSSTATLQVLQVLQVLRTSGAPQREPLRFHYVDALARRLTALAGPVRQLLETRLAAALADLQQRLAVAGTGARAAPASVALAPGPLAALAALAALARRDGTGPAQITHASTAPPPELLAVQRFAATWAQLRVDQQLRRSLTRQPDNAGPLNSQRLVLQTLQQLRHLSPAYLQRFMAHAEALLWLQDSSAAAAVPPSKSDKRSDNARARRPTQRSKP